MCSNAENPSGGNSPGPYMLGALGVKPEAGATPALLPLDQYRLQLYNYAVAERLRLSQLQQYSPAMPLCPAYPPGYGPRLALSMSLFHHRVLQPEEPKPQHSYIGLIAMAILSSPENKLVLSDIYQHILDNYPYFRSRGPGWRNSIRHNLSLNDCFVKAGRSANGKGHYWAVHPANVEDFRKGDFRRRKAQRKVRKHMGLAVDDEGNESPSPPPLSPPPTGLPPLPAFCWAPSPAAVFAPLPGIARKRQFDVASLLAPDDGSTDGGDATGKKLPNDRSRRPYLNSSGEEDNTLDEDIDVVTSDLEDKESGERSDKETSREIIESSRNRNRTSPLSPTAQYPLLNNWGMFPGFGVDHTLIGRYYEQLAQQQRRLQGGPPPAASPPLERCGETVSNSVSSGD